MCQKLVISLQPPATGVCLSSSRPVSAEQDAHRFSTCAERDALVEHHSVPHVVGGELRGTRRQIHPRTVFQLHMETRTVTRRHRNVPGRSKQLPISKASRTARAWRPRCAGLPFLLALRSTHVSLPPVRRLQWDYTLPPNAMM